MDMLQQRSTKQAWGMRAAWLLLALIVALYCGWRFAGPSPLQTNLLALLPATEADPVDLIRAARRGLGDKGYLIVAGSIDSPERIKAVASAGANAFTIGSAVFEEAFAKGVKGVRDQCKAVLRAVGT